MPRGGRSPAWSRRGPAGVSAGCRTWTSPKDNRGATRRSTPMSAPGIAPTTITPRHPIREMSRPCRASMMMMARDPEASKAPYVLPCPCPASWMAAYAAGWYVLTPIPASTRRPITSPSRGMIALAKTAREARRNPKPMRRPRCILSDNRPVSIEATAIIERYTAIIAPAAAYRRPNSWRMSGRTGGRMNQYRSFAPWPTLRSTETPREAASAPVEDVGGVWVLRSRFPASSPAPG